jgi:hypothetical protein
MLVPAHAGEMSIAASVPRWTLDDTLEREWDDAAHNKKGV